ncbi:MAG TPA: hypothetical protein VK424_00495 [Thermoplasmata archaeon]|nr:hypothetical protein [Thermoplasmata archaeon]
MSNLRQKNPKASQPDVDGPGAASAPTADTSVSESFRQNLEAARKALERGFGRFRPAHLKEKKAEAAVPKSPAGDLVARLQEGLRKEREFILIPLLDRLDAFAGRLLAGKPLPAQPLEEGLALVERYRLQLHDAHLHLLEQTYAELPNDASSRLAYQQLTSDYDHARVRWVTVRVMVSGYESKYAGYRGLLGLTLSQQCRAEKAWHEFEEEYVRTNLPSAFTSELAGIWTTELDKARDEGRADHSKVDDFLARTAQYLSDPA